MGRGPPHRRGAGVVSVEASKRYRSQMPTTTAPTWMIPLVGGPDANDWKEEGDPEFLPTGTEYEVLQTKRDKSLSSGRYVRIGRRLFKWPDCP